MLSHQITVLGTPAEEDIGGKIDLMEAGAFDDVDMVFMAHPAQQDISFQPCIAIHEQVSNRFLSNSTHKTPVEI